MDITILPMINACLNFSAGVLLVLGYKAIKRGDQMAHRKLMISALVVSTVFLISYLTYHYLHGSTKYTKEGIIRFVYFTILITHTPLAALVVPFCIAAVYFALKGDYRKHIRITKWLYPVWMYVSVTGVVIYLMLYVF
ncbi:MAG: DUF420 domain-containing protein [Candidatus Omnitrophota bacterium]